MLKRILLWTIALIFAAIAVGAGWIYLNRDAYKEQLVQAVSEYLKVPVRIQSVDVDVLSRFPLFSVEVNEAFCEGSNPLPNMPLFDLEKIAFGFEFWDLVQGDAVLKHIFLENGKVVISDPSNGKPNFDILNLPEESEDSDSTLTVEIHHLQLKNVEVVYLDKPGGVNVDVKANLLDSDMLIDGSVIHSAVILKGEILKIAVDGDNYFSDEKVDIKTLLWIDLEKKNLSLNDIDLSFKQLKISGRFSTDLFKNPYLNAHATISGEPIQDIYPLIPEATVDFLKSISCSGNVNAKFEMQGRSGKGDYPDVKITAPLKDLNISLNKNSPLKIQAKAGEFTYSNTNFFKEKTASVSIKDAIMLYAQRELDMNFEVPSIADEHCIFSIKGILDLENAFNISGIKGLSSPAGELNIDFGYEGPIPDSDEGFPKEYQAAGSLKFEDLRFKLNRRNTIIKDLSGELNFNNEILAFSDLSSTFGSSKLVANGYILNFLNALIFTDQRIHASVDLKSPSLNLSDFLQTSIDTTEFQFYLNPLVSLDFKCKSDEVIFKSFYGQNLDTKIQIFNQQAFIDQTTMEIAGGKVNMNLTIDAQDSNSIKWQSEFDLDQILLDSGFSIFYNFGQDFISSKNLGGIVDAEVELQMESNSYLEFNPSSTNSIIDAVVSNGRLKNFEPLESIEKYIDKSGDITDVTFERLENRLVVHEQKVLIPEMKVLSSVREVTIRGWHGFDNQFEYHLQVPIFSSKKKDPDSRYGIVEDAKGMTSVYLLMEGNPDDYDVRYDRQEVVKKVKDSFRLEQDEFLQMFKRKKKEDNVELEEDEYFEIDQ